MSTNILTDAVHSYIKVYTLSHNLGNLSIIDTCT